MKSLGHAFFLAVRGIRPYAIRCLDTTLNTTLMAGTERQQGVSLPRNRTSRLMPSGLREQLAPMGRSGMPSVGPSAPPCVPDHMLGAYDGHGTQKCEWRVMKKQEQAVPISGANAIFWRFSRGPTVGLVLLRVALWVHSRATRE